MSALVFVRFSLTHTKVYYALDICRCSDYAVCVWFSVVCPRWFMCDRHWLGGVRTCTKSGEEYVTEEFRLCNGVNGNLTLVCNYKAQLVP